MTEKQDDNRTYYLGLDDEDVIGKYIGIIKNIRRKVQKEQEQKKTDKEREEKDKKEGKGISFFYRGQMNEKYDPVPYVLRSEQYGYEDLYWHEIQKLRENDFSGKSHLDKLLMMQHYACPTRMMDVSSSPLTALFFACYSLTGKYEENFSNDGVVYVYTQETRKVKYFNSDTALVLACLAKFNEDDKKLLYERCKKGGKLKVKNSKRKYKDVIERFYYEIRSEHPAFSEKIKCEDLLNPLFVRPNDKNRRIQRQHGAFIMAGLTEDNKDAVKQIKKLKPYKIVIHYGKKKQILKDLELLNVNRATLLPDLENTAYYLIEKYTNKNGLYEI
ncbi:MAG: FRG domain-containing protein [Acetobacter sp.]|nr:FRG domain-containing protein [Acetobacter sp.]